MGPAPYLTCLPSSITHQLASAFSSSFRREQTFTDEQWKARLFNPNATTFIARDADEDGRILSSLTLLGPGTSPEHLRSELGLTSQVLCWDINGVFTLPSARRRGIAAAVMDAAKNHARGTVVSRGCGCLLKLVVYTDNGGAKAWYEKMGFKVYQDGEDQGRPTRELAMLLGTKNDTKND